ncbi:hypothetical protein Ppb6_00775 [Photorhabdus australis subsp. thailandensis]|uniref:Uncharacterized protein n=1 Tax=Photorhabdus australis subsp. thailandensis TaxID=2805096 RepID=A0A1C0U7X8_9GAMM|nr:hypothetical protein Ppb6_00775 [Photorhabdus australis subsp. thailandensis]
MFGSKFFPNENGFPTTKNPAVFNMFKQLVLTLSGQYHLEINNIPVIFQVASLLAALTHPSHRVIYAPGDSLLGRRDAS